MTINPKGLAIIQQFEGRSLTVYADIVGLKTVGWGHRTDAEVGTTISVEDADLLLHNDLVKFEQGVARIVDTSLTSNQFSALVCLAFNIGLNALEGSTLLKHANAEQWTQAADSFLSWCHAGKEVVPGLLRRRQAERALFLE